MAYPWGELKTHRGGEEPPKGYAMFKLTTNDGEAQTREVQKSLDELAREGARRMILEALELEVEQYVENLRHLRDEQGHAMVVRNGKSRYERTVNLGAGPVKIKAPRVNDRRPEHKLTSNILPPYMRRSPRLEEALPVLYLRRLSTGDFSEALKALLGPEAAGFSATSMARLRQAAAEDVAGRLQSLEKALSPREAICVPLGRRCLLERSPGGGSSGLPGDRRGAPRWSERGRCTRRRLSRVHRVLGCGPKGSQAPRPDGTCACRRRW